MSGVRVVIAAVLGGYAWEAFKGSSSVAHGWVRGSKSNARESEARALAELERAARGTT